MPISLDEFWKLAIKSGLLAATEQPELVEAFDRGRGDQPADPKSLSKWLIERGMLSQYQAKLLLSGRSGPFHFGDYRVYDRIESGRLAGMFRAGHLHSGQPALLYFFGKTVTQDAALWQQVQAQAQQAMEVKHPHVSRVDELVLVDGYKLAALETMDGATLADYLRKKPLPVGHVLRYARKVAAALARLHKLGQAHGDVRPENVLLDSAGQLKLLFFPLARELTASDAPRARQADFLAPELWGAGPLGATPAGDMYALGATIYLLITGQAPFAGADLAEKARRHASETPPTLAPTFQAPSGLTKLIGLMLSKDPESRPRSMNQVADALASLDGKGESKAAAANKNGSTEKNGASQPQAIVIPTGVPTAASAPMATAVGATAVVAAPTAIAVAPGAQPLVSAAPMGTVVAAGMGPPMGTVAVAVAGSRPSPGVATAVTAFPPQAIPAGMPLGAVVPGGFAMGAPVATAVAHGQPAPVMTVATVPAPGAPFVAVGYPGQPAAPTAVAVPTAAAIPTATAAPPETAAPAAAGGISAEVLESFAPDPLAERSERREPKAKRKKGKGINPTYVGIGVTVLVMIVGGVVALYMTNAPAPTAIKDSVEFERVQAEMRAHEGR